MNEVVRMTDRDRDLIRCLELASNGDLNARPSGSDLLSRAVEMLVEAYARSVAVSLDNVVAQTVGANETAVSSGQMLKVARDVDV